MINNNSQGLYSTHHMTVKSEYYPILQVRKLRHREVK